MIVEVKLMERDKSLGERLGEAADAVRSKVNEVSDRARAESHDFKAETSNDPVERLTEKGKGLVDRVKAEVHEANADRQADNAKRDR